MASTVIISYMYLYYKDIEGLIRKLGAVFSEAKSDVCIGSNPH